jgi:hypothetical protein
MPRSWPFTAPSRLRSADLTIDCVALTYTLKVMTENRRANRTFAFRLALLVVVVAVIMIGRGASHRREIMIGPGASHRREAGVEANAVNAVKEWVHVQVLIAYDGVRDSLGAAPMVGDELVSWAREVEGGPVALLGANVSVRAVGAWGGEEGVPALATHVAEVQGRNARATLGIKWPAGGPSGQAQPAIVSFRRTAPRRRAGCQGPGRSPRRRG